MLPWLSGIAATAKVPPAMAANAAIVDITFAQVRWARSRALRVLLVRSAETTLIQLIRLRQWRERTGRTGLSEKGEEMSESVWTRLAAAAGLVFVGLVIVTRAIAPEAPSFEASGTELASYYSENRDELQELAYVGALTGIVFIPFLAVLVGAIRRIDGMLAWIVGAAGIGALAVGFAQNAVTATLAYGAAREADPGLVRTLHDLEAVLSPGIIVFPLALVVAGASVAAIGGGALPRWLGLYGAVLSVALLAGGSVLFADGATFELGGDYTQVVRAGLLAWIVAASVSLMRRERSHAAATQVPAASPAA
jgi:hypothetical protein